MNRPERSETVGVLLLGIVLFALALTLRAGQPGMLEIGVPWCVWPIGAAVIYAAAAVFMAGATLQGLVLLALMAVAHTLDAALMGLAFAATNELPPGVMGGFLVEGLGGYPPAVALQVAFVVPFAWFVLRRRAAPEGQGKVPGSEVLARATTPEELLHAVLTVEAMQPQGADPALAAVARRARALLVTDPAEGTEQPTPAAPAETPGPQPLLLLEEEATPLGEGEGESADGAD